jgi:hypothetical protein
MSARIRTVNGANVEYDLPYSCWEGKVEYNLGIFIIAVYIGKVAKRCIIKLDSIHQKGDTGERVGEYYLLVDSECERERLAGMFPDVAALLYRLKMLPTPKETAKKRAMYDLEREYKHWSPETTKHHCDQIIIEFLNAIGHTEVADLYKKIV